MGLTTCKLTVLVAGLTLAGCGSSPQEIQTAPAPATRQPSQQSPNNNQNRTNYPPQQQGPITIGPNTPIPNSNTPNALPNTQPGPAPAVNPGNVPNPVAGEVAIPIDQIFDQGNTQWCWAYSAFHTLRTYYFNNTSTDPGVKAWRDALSKLNTADAFSNYMSQHVDTGTTGNPDMLVDMLQSDYKLPSQNWTDFNATGFGLRAMMAASRGFALQTYSVGNQDMGKSQILQKIQQNIRQKIPVSFCNSSHCIMVYGFVSNGADATQYDIGDSAGGQTYREDASEFSAELEMVMTLP